MTFVPTLKQATDAFSIANRSSDERQKAVAIKKLTKTFALVDTNKSRVQVQREGKSLVAYAKEIGEGNIEKGESEVEKIIMVLLINLNNYFNITNGLTASQIAEIAVQIYEECKQVLTIEEIVYIFKKKKYESELFNRLDGNIIFKWIDEHIAKRGDERYSEHQDIKAGAFVESQLDDNLKNMNKKLAEKYVQRDLQLITGREAQQAKQKTKKK